MWGAKPGHEFFTASPRPNIKKASSQGQPACSSGQGRPAAVRTPGSLLLPFSGSACLLARLTAEPFSAPCLPRESFSGEALLLSEGAGESSSAAEDDACASSSPCEPPPPPPRARSTARSTQQGREGARGCKGSRASPWPAPLASHSRAARTPALARCTKKE